MKYIFYTTSSKQKLLRNFSSSGCSGNYVSLHQHRVASASQSSVKICARSKSMKKLESVCRRRRRGK